MAEGGEYYVYVSRIISDEKVGPYISRGESHKRVLDRCPLHQPVQVRSPRMMVRAMLAK